MNDDSSPLSVTGSGQHPSPGLAEDVVAQGASRQIVAPEPDPTIPTSHEPQKSTDGKMIGASAPAAEAHPMIVTEVASSGDANGNQNGLGQAAAYGTRSRNRVGTSRPNYAEDKELDADYDTASLKEVNGRKGSRMAEPSTMVEEAQTSNGGPNSHVPEPEHLLTIQSQNHHRGPIPGTSTFSANSSGIPLNPNSKKRKAAGQAVPTSLQTQLQIASQHSPQGQSGSQGASVTTQVLAGFRESNMLEFDQCAGRLKNNKLIADDGTILEVNDHVYLVCEPPGEPYYLGRIMEFLHVNNDNSQPIDALRLNWYYRAKDIGRKVNDTRQVFASMHSDISPLTALRGKCQIKHKSEVEKLDDLRRSKDSFWYEKLYDRYIHRFYDVIPTSLVINVPVEVKQVLDERWRYIVVEPGRGKELTSAVKSCKRCNKYCASDSVDCAVCQNTYHMSCVNPPLLKKPSRGFAWACGPCSKAQEKRLEARNTPNMTEPSLAAEDDINEEDMESPAGPNEDTAAGRASPTKSPEKEVQFHPGTEEQIHQASLWLFRYLGMHCKVEDALDYDDRIYPRASSRLGPRHQANVPAWPGRPVEYVKPVEIKKKYLKGGGQKKDAKLSKETVSALEADKIARENRPKWVMDEPPGYVARGEDYDTSDDRNTATLLYRRPEADDLSIVHENGSTLDEHAREQLVFGYMARAGALARPLGLPTLSTNLLDVALETLYSHDFEVEKSLQALIDLDKQAFKEPELSPAELKKFEDGVAKYGSEWHSIKKHVKTLKPKDVVRFYYTWKKTERGKQIWGNYTGRKGKKEAKRAEATAGKLQDDVADEHDDSAFDNDKAVERKRGSQCKFCATQSSRQWRRAPNTPAGTMVLESTGAKATAKDKGPCLMIALCRRCAELWRRYAIQWEDVDEVAKKVAQAGGRAWKRKIDEELLKELVAANEVVNYPPNIPLAPHQAESTLALLSKPPQTTEVARRKGKGVIETSDTLPEAAGITTPGQKRKTAADKLPPPLPVLEPPKPRVLPCAICREMDPMGDQHLTCKECRLSVHRNCYGVVGENRSPNKWVCDMCSNDKNPQVSIQYKCMLCPVEITEHDFVEPPKITNKKRTEKDRERERIERDMNTKAADFFRKKQEEMNRPLNPREPLKRTANNNWVHVTCAVFTPEVKFGCAKALEPSEGIPSIASGKYDEICTACKHRGGACVACQSCKTPVHVECAHQSSFVLGFDITPVKGSRREQANVVNIGGEVGMMTAAIWCEEHVPTKTIVHRMHNIVDDAGLNALQLYVQNYKQADLTLTGTVRKATLVNQSTKVVNPPPILVPANRRTSTTAINGAIINGRGSISSIRLEEVAMEKVTSKSSSKVCATCGVDVSPKWWSFPSVAVEKSAITNAPSSVSGNQDLQSQAPLVNGHNVSLLLVDPTSGHAALAAAALHQHPDKLANQSGEVQCHQCHARKVRRDPTPPPPLPPALPVIPQDISRPLNAIPSSTVVTAPEADVVGAAPHYSWPQPPRHSYPNGPYSWRRHSPPPQALSLSQLNGGNSPHINQLNGNHSPRLGHGTSQQQAYNGHAQIRPPVQTMLQSPRQNGDINGYPASPRHVPSTATHIPNGVYGSYASVWPPPQHLTNGGPPPRAPEHPFSQGQPPLRHGSSYGQPQGSPPLYRDSQSQSRETSNIQNGGRPVDGRVNGGASASPSLRNLLS